MAGWGVWAGLFVLSLGLQWQTGAWQSDFGGHADEAAHVVTGLMVRDYLAGGFREQGHPLRFAEAYYERFPKVAIGHYPPGFYALEGLWLLPVRAPGAVLVLMAALSGMGGWLTWLLGKEMLRGRGAALALAGLFCLLPLVRTYTAIVMSDLLLVIFVVLATVAFGRFAERGQSRDSWAFGLWAAAAILTKGSGLLLALVPPLTIALTGRWALLANRRLWLGAVPVAVLALPWMVATRHITAEGMTEGSFLAYLAGAARFYPGGIAREFGLLMTFLLLVAAGGLIRSRWGRSGAGVAPQTAALWSLVIGLPLFYGAIPSGMDVRYLLPLLPAVLVLAGETMESLTARLWAKALPWAVIGLAAAVFADTWRPVEKRYGGATETMARVLETAGPVGPGGETVVLVVAEAGGEGALTAAAAFTAPSRLRVLRGSKVLASSDWLGRGYEAKFADAAGLALILRDRGADFAVVETPPGPFQEDAIPQHHRWTLKILADRPDWVTESGEISSARKRGLAGAFRWFDLSVSDQGGAGAPAVSSSRN